MNQVCVCVCVSVVLKTFTVTAFSGVQHLAYFVHNTLVISHPFSHCCLTFPFPLVSPPPTSSPVISLSPPCIITCLTTLSHLSLNYLSPVSPFSFSLPSLLPACPATACSPLPAQPFPASSTLCFTCLRLSPHLLHLVV